VGKPLFSDRLIMSSSRGALIPHDRRCRENDISRILPFSIPLRVVRTSGCVLASFDSATWVIPSSRGEFFGSRFNRLGFFRDTVIWMSCQELSSSTGKLIDPGNLQPQNPGCRNATRVAQKQPKLQKCNNGTQKVTH
jgi:hypothetical protein